MKLILIAALFFLGCGSSNKGLNASDVNMRELGNELYGDEDVTFKGLIKSGKTKKGTLFERNTEHHLYEFSISKERRSVITVSGSNRIRVYLLKLVNGGERFSEIRDTGGANVSIGETLDDGTYFIILMTSYDGANYELSLNLQ